MARELLDWKKKHAVDLRYVVIINCWAMGQTPQKGRATSISITRTRVSAKQRRSCSLALSSLAQRYEMRRWEHPSDRVASPRSVAGRLARDELGTERRPPTRNVTHFARRRELCGSAQLKREMLEWSMGRWMREPALTDAYCSISDAKSTIALAFSTDGELFASTNGDHTVKVFWCNTWKHVRTLRGHERTPWTVKFHPHDRHILASGSLDQTVRVWNVATGECLHRKDFLFVVSCISFHSSGELLAVTAGKRISLWRWDEPRDDDATLPRRPSVSVMLEGEQPQRCVAFKVKYRPIFPICHTPFSPYFRN